MTNAHKTNWALYILRCADNSLYTGVTTDLKRRLKEHGDQGPKTAKYLRGKAPLHLVYWEQSLSKSDALRRELEIKSLTKSEKEELLFSFNK